jgi:hypothetical protein
MNMNEILAGLAGIESKLNGLDSDTRLKMREFADELLALKQRGVASLGDPITGGLSPERRIAEAISGELDGLRKNRQMAIEVKAFSGTPITSAQVSTGTGLPGLAVPAGVYHGILQMIPLQPLGASSSVKYIRENIALSTGGADVQAGEGAAKPWYQPGFQLITQEPITVVALTKISEQSARNQPELTRAVEALIRRDLALSIDRIVLLGSTTTAWAGLMDMATEDVSAIWWERVDAIMECQVTMEILGSMPAAVMMNGGDWLQTALDKNSVTGAYKVGPEGYLKEVERRIGSMRVGLSTNVDAGSALLIDPMFFEIYVSQDVNVQMAYVADDFEKNLMSLRVETEIVPVLRSTRGVRISQPKPGG